MASFKYLQNGKVEITITHGKRFDGKPNRYYKTVDFISKKQLEQESAMFLADILRGGANIGTNSTVDDIYKHYMEHNVDIKKSTNSRYITLYERQIKPYLGNKKISKITRTDIREWVKYIQLYGHAKTHGELAPKTVKNALSFLSSLFKYAIYDLELIDKNPCEKIKVQKQDIESKIKKELYTESEVREMLKLLAEELKKPEDITHATIILVILFTGMRSGEAMGLKWDCIDFDKKQISIESERIYLPEVGTITDTPKTEGSIRTISASQFIIILLKNLKSFQDECKKIFGDDYVDSGYVVSTMKGKPQHPRNTYSWFIRFQKKHGLKHTTVHDLRHAHAAMLSRLDVKIIDISKRLGHTNTRITQEVYEYLFKDIDSTVSEKLDDYYKNVLS